MISPRFAIPVSILLVLALVPTVIHSYIGARKSDGFRSEAISSELNGLPSEPTNRREKWVRDTFSSDDWMERRYLRPDGTHILLFVIRSYDFKKIYHHPEIGILRGIDLESRGTVRASRTPDIPVHLFKGRNGSGTAAYALLYNGKYVESPILMQLQTSFELLFGSRKQMTLFFIYDGATAAHAEFGGSTAETMLVEAIDSFLSQEPHSKYEEP